MTKWQRDLKKSINVEGFTVLEMERAAKHYKFVLEKDGIQFMVFPACTPTDQHHALMQFKQDVKRQFRVMKEKA